jgi:hypothetical protein
LSDSQGPSRWSLRKRLLVATIGVLALAEIASYVAIRMLGILPERPYRQMYRESACLKANDFNYGKYARSPAAMQVMLSKVPHPYFGFTVNPERTNPEWRDSLVSADYENEVRYRKMLDRGARGKDTYTIGIFGASVAGAFAEHVMHDDAFRRRLESEIPALHGRRIEIRQMAIGSSRQPAQFAIAAYYVELFDMTINLDGYSEIAVIQYPQFPIEYPMFSDVFYSPGDASSYLKLRTGEEVCRRMSELPSWIPPLAVSNTYYLFWHSVSLRLNAALYAPAAPAESERASPFSADEVRELYVDYYAKYTRLQDQVLSANGVHDYYFLQPNQYAESSKTFSDEERANALNYGDSEEITRRYRMLSERVRTLHDAGLPVFDLTPIYRDVADTVYVDSCCHVNELGNRILADRIADVIVREENRRGTIGAP